MRKDLQKGFAITGMMMVWAVGFVALFGGGAYVVNEKFGESSRGQAKSEQSDKRGGAGADADHSFTPTHDDLVGIPMGELSDIEREGLIFMREEEKLARDVYSTFFELWGVKIFQNISYSEDRHTLAVKELLDRYGAVDPVMDDAVGVFTIPEMQTLYNDLVAQGSTSLLDALKVGATIEDLDIYDLNKWIASNDNEDIATVYASLARGSRNHMRSFDKQIIKNGGTYTAQFLSQVEIDEILAGEQEKGAQQGGGKQRGSNR